MARSPRLLALRIVSSFEVERDESPVACGFTPAIQRLMVDYDRSYRIDAAPAASAGSAFPAASFYVH